MGGGDDMEGLDKAMILRSCHLHAKDRWKLVVIDTVDLGVSKNRGVSPQIIHFNRVFHYKRSILGYHYFGENSHFLYLHA